MVPSRRAYVTADALKMDVLPMLTKVIVPALRPVSLHLFTEQEKEDLSRVVNVMIDYNITYVQERTPEGAYLYNMGKKIRHLVKKRRQIWIVLFVEPNVDELVGFSSCQSKKTLPYFNKQLIAHEIDLEKMRRDNNKRGITCKSELKEKNKECEKQLLPNHLQKLSVRDVQPKGAVSTSLFLSYLI